MTPRFDNRVAIVTGGASGIGRALCQQLAFEGAVVVVTDVNLPGAQEVAHGIRGNGHRAEAIELDVARPLDVERVVNDVAAAHGRLDFMFNNAAIAVVGELRDGNIEDFRRVVDVNLFGVVHGTMAAYRLMLRQQCGHIVNTSSMTGLMPTPIISAYSTTKWAIIGFSSALRLEAAALGVRVSVACPALVRTNMGDANVYWNLDKQQYLARLPWRWMMEPPVAAKAILRGVARNEGVIVFPFSGRVAWWLYRVCPALFAPLLQRMVQRFREIRLKP
jgi:NAD(P)-dependent dehydrogenase (short-subunit alcohol dehydrogenase family)